MNQAELTTTVPLQGVSVTVKGATVTVKGKNGELSRTLFHPGITFTVGAEDVSITAKDATKREKKMLYTFASHLKNMIEGATQDFEYKLKVCSGHFPMTVAIKGDILEVKNYIGEAVPRTVPIDKRTKVAIDGVIITVTSADLEAAGQMAARIESMCKRSGFDRRIFQDGIYITHKCGKAV